MDSEHLRTLAAVLDEGSFDAAATALRLTPSAVSQRIRALETEVGQVVVLRTLPTVPTATGEVLLRQARQRALLEQEMWAELGSEGPQDATGRASADPASRFPLPVAVNADSLDTWFAGVIDVAATWRDVTMSVRVDDQDHTRELLRSGQVMGAVTAEPQPVAGCRAVTLGAMRYVPVLTPALRDEHRTGRRMDWEHLPLVRFNAKDDLQARHLQRLGVSVGPSQEVPASGAYVRAVRSGLGWGLVPEAQIGDSLRTGELVRLDRGHEDVELHWHYWRLDSTRLARLTEAIRREAALALRQR